MTRLLPSVSLLLQLVLNVLPGYAAYSPGTPIVIAGGVPSRFRLEHLTLADGIVGEYVFQILQDRHGFIWFSTTNGLSRYDGYHVVEYADVPTRKFHTISVAGLLYEDRNGGLWVGAEILARLDPGSGAFTRFTLPEHGRGAPRTETITALHDDAKGFLWLASTEPVLYRFDPRTGAFAEHWLDLSITKGNSGSIRAIEQDKHGTFWLGTSYGLVRFDPSTDKFAAYSHTAFNPDIREEYTFNGLVWDQTGMLWVHVPRGLARFNPDIGSFDRFTEAGFWNMVADPSGTVWLYGGWPGLRIFDPKTGTLTEIRNPSITPSGSERDDGVGALLPDRDGNVWVNFRQSGGLDRFSPTVSRFGKFLPDPGDPAALSGGPVSGFSEDSDGNIWISTSGHGLNRLDPGTSVVTHFGVVPGDRRGLDSDEIYSMYEDRSGTFWLGTYKGIGRFDRKSGTYTQLRGPIDGRESILMLDHKSGGLWVADWSGRRHLLDTRSGELTQVDAVGAGYVAHEDRAGNVWFGTSAEGLLELDTTGTIRWTSLARTGSTSWSGEPAIHSLYEDLEGILWIGTQAGLFRFDPQSNNATRYSTADGLPENAIMCVVPDDLGNLWLSTFQSGISRLNMREKRFYNYDVSNGLQANSFTERACYQARDGRLYFGGRLGFNAFFPSEVLAPLPEPAVVLTEFQVNGGRPSSLPGPIWDLDFLQLQNGQNAFSFEFAALGYVNSRKTRYRFKLEGLETQWTEADSMHRLARYTGIKPGTYVFRVQASSDGHAWGTKEASLRLTIMPPWWKNPWSESAAMLGIAAIVFRVRKLRLKALEDRHHRLRRLVEERTAELVAARDQAREANLAKTTFLANMSHELRTPLNSILGFSNLLRENGASKKQRRDLDIINRSGEHLLNLINDVLDVAKIETGRETVDIGPCDLGALVRDVTDMVRVRAEKKNLKLTIVTSHGFPLYVQTDAAKLRHVLINLIDNAVRYTEKGTVSLRINATSTDRTECPLVKFEVEDTGIGIAAEDLTRIFDAFVQVDKRSTGKGNGLGLTITRQFVALMGGTLRVESTLGKGSLFKVELPVERAQKPDTRPIAGERKQVIGLQPGQPEYRILIVEDQKENWMVLERLLQRVGLRVRVAEDSAQGVEIFRTWRPHFIWIDLRMPLIYGVEAVRRIRAMEGGRDVKIAALTASAFVCERDEVLAKGMDDFLRKPYRASEIFDCMARHLSVRYRLAEAEPKSTGRPAAGLRPEAFAALPEDLREELEKALLSLDSNRIGELIDGVSKRDAVLGSLLARHAERFAFTQVLEALRAAKGYAR